MTRITTHILDTSRGRPAANVRVELARLADSGAWEPVGHTVTDADGRARNLHPAPVPTGLYRLTFHTFEYAQQHNQPTFYPFVEVHFGVSADDDHYHVPLLLNPFGYSTYRGS